MNSMRAVLEHELSNLYSVETQLLDALPKMAQGVTEPQLQAALKKHWGETQQHVSRLEHLSATTGIELRGQPGKGIAGLIAEGSDLLADDDASIIRDAAIIAAAQRIEHYEIAAYGSARTFAELLGQNEIVQILDETLTEEKSADALLSRIAESRVNNEAFREGGDAYQAVLGNRVADRSA